MSRTYLSANSAAETLLFRPVPKTTLAACWLASLVTIGALVAPLVLGRLA